MSFKSFLISVVAWYILGVSIFAHGTTNIGTEVLWYDPSNGEDYKQSRTLTDSEAYHASDTDEQYCNEPSHKPGGNKINHWHASYGSGIWDHGSLDKDNSDDFWDQYYNEAASDCTKSGTSNMDYQCFGYALGILAWMQSSTFIDLTDVVSKNQATLIGSTAHAVKITMTETTKSGNKVHLKTSEKYMCSPIYTITYPSPGLSIPRASRMVNINIISWNDGAMSWRKKNY